MRVESSNLNQAPVGCICVKVVCGVAEVVFNRTESLIHCECVLYTSLYDWLRELNELSDLVRWCALMFPVSQVAMENGSVSR